MIVFGAKFFGILITISDYHNHYKDPYNHNKHHAKIQDCSNQYL